jgi:hypothetical protein
MFLAKNRPLVRYLLWTMAIGGSMGVCHGVTSTANTKKLRPAAILHDGMAGVIVGPWSPIFVPLVLTGIWPSKCPYYKNQNRK